VLLCIQHVHRWYVCEWAGSNIPAWGWDPARRTESWHSCSAWQSTAGLGTTQRRSSQLPATSTAAPKQWWLFFSFLFFYSSFVFVRLYFVFIFSLCYFISFYFILCYFILFSFLSGLQADHHTTTSKYIAKEAVAPSYECMHWAHCMEAFTSRVQRMHQASVLHRVTNWWSIDNKSGIVPISLAHTTCKTVKSAAGSFALHVPQLLPGMHRTPSKLCTPWNHGTHGNDKTWPKL